MRKMSDLVRDQNPLTLPSSASVLEAARKMRARSLGAVLVTNGTGALTGIFMGRDAVARVLAEGRDPAKTTLLDVMTVAPETITPDQKAIDALRLMQRIRTLASRYTIVLIEHNMRLVMELSSEITVMNFGRVLARGTPDTVRADPRVREAYLGTRTW